MKRFTTLATVFALLVLALGPSVAFSQQPAAPVVRHQFRVAGAPLSGPYDLGQQTLSFAPGAASPRHTHPGLFLVTVVEGALTFRVNDTEQVYHVGDSYVELPGPVGQARNTTAANTRAVVSFVIPDGTPSTVPVPDDTTPPPHSVVGVVGRTDADPPPSPYEVGQWVIDFAPGAATPWHTHAGQLLVTVLEGELTFNLNNMDQVYQAGESFVEVPNEVAQARNASATPTVLLVTALLPKGAPFLHPVPLPGTGRDGQPILVLAVAATLLLGGAVIRGRRQVRR